MNSILTETPIQAARRTLDRIVDTYVARDPDAAADFNGFRTIFDGIATPATEIHADTRLTAEGKTAAFAARSERFRAALTQHVDASSALEHEIAATEERALRLRPAPDGRGYVEARLDRTRTDDERQAESFVWAQLAQKTGTAVEQMVTRAIHDGNFELLEAVDRMPAAFSPLDAAAQARCRKLRVEKSPVFEHLTKLRNRLDARRHIASATTRAVEEIMSSLR